MIILKEEPLLWQDYNDPPVYNDKDQQALVIYPDSKKHIGLLYDPSHNRESIVRKREIIKRYMDAGIDHSIWYCAPVFDLARELGLIDENHYEDNETSIASLNLNVQQKVLATPDIEKHTEVVDDFRQSMMMSIDQCRDEIFNIKAKLDYEVMMRHKVVVSVSSAFITFIMAFMLAYYFSFIYLR